jgi:hypothetical protein
LERKRPVLLPLLRVDVADRDPRRQAVSGNAELAALPELRLRMLPFKENRRQHYNRGGERSQIEWEVRDALPMRRVQPRRTDVDPPAQPSQEMSPLQNKNAKTLPKILPGVVLPQMIRCGRPNCRCAQGHLHGPYYYRFWREDGKLRKAYVKPTELELVRALCDARRQARRKYRAALETWRQLRAAIRALEEQE